MRKGTDPLKFLARTLRRIQPLKKVIMLSCTCLRTPRFDCRQRSGSTLLANQCRGCDYYVHSERGDFWAKRMSLFIAPLYQTSSRVCYIMSDNVLWPTCRFVRCDKLPDPPPGLNSEVPGDCGGSRQTWAGGTSSPACWTLKAAADSSRRIIACELTSCNASIGKEAGWLSKSPGR